MLVLTSSSFLLILAARVSSVNAQSFLARRAGPQARNSQPEALAGARKAAPLLARGRGDEPHGVTPSFLDTAMTKTRVKRGRLNSAVGPKEDGIESDSFGAETLGIDMIRKSRSDKRGLLASSGKRMPAAELRMDFNVTGSPSMFSETRMLSRVQRGGGNQLPRSGSKPKITDPATHCPGKDDWAVYDARGSFFQDDVKEGWGVGWKLSHNGKGAGIWGVASQFTMNIVGGFVEFTGADISKVADGANSNVYITSPPDIFKEKPEYEGKVNTCDSGGGKPESCMELDIFESDGGCGFASTTHDPEGNNAGPCKGGGYACQFGWFAPKGKFDMRLEIDDDGCATYYVDTRDGKGMRQIMDKKAMDCPGTKAHLEQNGALVRSTQWTGWTYMKEHPEFTPSCAPYIQAYNALQQGSEMSIDGVRFKGKHKQGKEPAKSKAAAPPASTAKPESESEAGPTPAPADAGAAAADAAAAAGAASPAPPLAPPPAAGGCCAGPSPATPTLPL